MLEVPVALEIFYDYLESRQLLEDRIIQIHNYKLQKINTSIDSIIEQRYDVPSNNFKLLALYMDIKFYEQQLEKSYLKKMKK